MIPQHFPDGFAACPIGVSRAFKSLLVSNLWHNLVVMVGDFTKHRDCNVMTILFVIAHITQLLFQFFVLSEVQKFMGPGHSPNARRIQ